MVMDTIAVGEEQVLGTDTAELERQAARALQASVSSLGERK